MYRRKTVTPYLSLVIPVYNESRRLERGLNHALNYLTAQKYPWEIIIVDDGSTDTTPLIYSHFIHNHAHLPIYFLRTAKNFGKGHAIRLGIEAAEGDYIFFSDIDLSVSLDHIPQFLATLKQVDVVVGSRRLPQSHIAQHQNILRESLGRGFTKISNIMLGLSHTDLTCGFKGFKNSAAKNIFNLSRLNGWAFDSEILFLVHKSRQKVKEISVTWENDPHTKVNMLKDIVTSFIDLIKIRLWHG